MSLKPIIKVDIPKTIKPEDREDLGHDIVEFIRQRTESGKDANGNTFPGYSKAYMKSLDFKIAGKTKRVNLTLSGDMLAELDVLRHKAGEITIGYDRGSENYGKAEGNINGSYGGDDDKKKARNFLGISKADLKKILAKYEDD